jgi:hypothetical protein
LRADILATVTIGGGLVFLLLVAWGYVSHEAGQESSLRSARSTGPGGTLACFELYQRLGYPIRISEEPLSDETLKQIDVLMLIDPEAPLAESEIASIRQWVRRGGVLVGSGNVGSLSGNISLRLPQVRFSSRNDTTRTHVADEDRGKPLARDVASLDLPSPWTLNISDTSSGAGAAEPLLSDDFGVRLTERHQGKGYILWLADSSFLANRWIGKEDNQVLAANVLTYALSKAAGRRAAYDEYHYYPGGRETGWTVLGAAFIGTPPGWALLCLTAAGLLYLVMRGRRFGTRRAPQKARRRSKLEYVHAVGATYRAAGAHRLTFGLVFTWFWRRIVRLAGLPPASSVKEVAASLGKSSPEAAARYEALLTECRGAPGAPINVSMI